ncbi:MAG: family 10 glycosylhydrolase [Clostridiales Family XIII bacterium]|jgi:uncharacterized lipoprotein YddW (UPF0748 family)|nr:family 10 glycosylhydrolase [Clostridiales Family XIII bacterium]
MQTIPVSRRRRIALWTALFLCASLLACFHAPARASAAADGEFRGVWVATVLTLNYPSAPTADPETLRRDALRILDNAKELGFNAVVFQVRPASDAFYRSALFPWSKYLTGVQGLAPADGFDPLAFIVQEAHARGLALHAWLNPYRITAETQDNEALAANHPARLHPEWTVTYSDGRMYWNPGEPGAQQLIADGVREIVENYDVDGIHIDDYFYPGADFGDAGAMAAYGAGYPSLAEWRRANTETTVKNMYDAVHGSGKDIVFGVSPVGIWANKSTSDLGSDTRGGEAYVQKFADTRGWVKRGIVDYIAPQIYWNIGFEVAEYVTLVDWWADVVAGTDVRLYVGQAAYRTGNADSASPWHGVSEISRQVEYNRGKPGVGGYIMYSYNSFRDSPELSALMKSLNAAPAVSVPPAVTVPPSRGDEGGRNPADASGAGSGLPDSADGTAAASAPFSDVSDHWAAEYIAELHAAGFASGYPDGRFQPDSQIKRADFYLMLVRMFGLLTENPGRKSFADVDPDAYYAEALSCAKQAGLVSGVGDNLFAPESPVTRQDLFTMTHRVLVWGDLMEAGGDPAALAAFADSAAVADYAALPMAAFVENRILTGADGRLEPLKTATRAEAATILCRVNRLWHPAE